MAPDWLCLEATNEKWLELKYASLTLREASLDEYLFVLSTGTASAWEL
jgi:hypothetical protein